MLKGRTGVYSTSQVVHVGGNSNNGSNARVFTLKANNATSNRNRNNGGHLATGSALPSLSLLHGRGEYVDPIRLGSESEQPGNQ